MKRKTPGPGSAGAPLPDVTTPPGEHLADTLRELKMSQSELARRMGRPVQAINQIVNGSKIITAETALQLEDVTSVPAHVWLNLEVAHQLAEARRARAATSKGSRPATRGERARRV